MSFVYDKHKKRRHVEGWNCVYFGSDDTIGLTGEEYDRIGFDFEHNHMYPQAIEAYKRAARRGRKGAFHSLGRMYEKTGDYEHAYEYYLEAALGNFEPAYFSLARMYENGIYVRKDEKRAAELYSLIDESDRECMKLAGW